MSKFLYWLSARPLFTLIGKGYTALRRLLGGIPGFDAFLGLATRVTDRIFGIVRFPGALEERFEPYIEFRRGRQMDRALVFAVLVYMAVLGAYPSSLGHLDTAPQIWIALPIVSGFNPYLGLVSGVVFSVFDWLGKWLPFESVYGADFGGGIQNFFGARVGYILAYTTLVLNGMLPGILARVFRQIVRTIGPRILPRKAGQAAMGLLMLLAAGALLYHVGGPRAVYAMSALSLMGIAMAMGPPPPGQGSPCVNCGALLPPGVHQCGCGGISQEARDVIDKKKRVEEEARQRQEYENQMRAQGGGRTPPPPPPPMPPDAGGDYLYEALATVGSMLGATVGIVVSYEWAQQVGNYGAFYALRADPDVSCRDLSAGNYGELQAQSPIPGAAAGAMPPGAAGAMTPDAGVMPDSNPPPPGTSRWIQTEDGREVPQIYDPSVGGWRTANHGDVDADGDVYDATIAGGAFVSQGISAAEAATRADNARWQEQQWENVRTGNTAHDRALREMVERQRREAELLSRQDSWRRMQLELEMGRNMMEANQQRAAAARWNRALAVATTVRAGADITMNALGSIPGPPGVIGRAYTIVSSGASGAAEAHARGDSAVWGGMTGTAQGVGTVIVQDAIGGAMQGAGQGMAQGGGFLQRAGNTFRGAFRGAGSEVANTARGLRTGYTAIRSGLRSGGSLFGRGASTAGSGMRTMGSAPSRGWSGAQSAGAHGASSSGMASAFGRGTGRGMSQGGSQVSTGLRTMGQGAGQGLGQAGRNVGRAMGPTGAADPGAIVRGISSGDRASTIMSGNNPVTHRPDAASEDSMRGVVVILEWMGYP